MVAIDGLSQALTNPLLSGHVWGEEAIKRATFTDEGLGATATARALARDSAGAGDAFVGMARPGWKRR